MHLHFNGADKGTVTEQVNEITGLKRGWKFYMEFNLQKPLIDFFGLEMKDFNLIAL